MTDNVILSKNFPLTKKQVASFCVKWQVNELALFGSVLREDFKSDSDVDVLVTFDLVRMTTELSELLNRRVDILTKKSVTRTHNWLRKQSILNTAKVIYESRLFLS